MHESCLATLMQAIDTARGLTELPGKPEVRMALNLCSPECEEEAVDLLRYDTAIVYAERVTVRDDD